MQEMTRERLDRFRNRLAVEIACLEEELKMMEDNDKINDNEIGNLEQSEYHFKSCLLEEKKKEQQYIKLWIESISDDRTRWVFKMWYIEKLNWKIIARKIGIPQNENYPRLHIRDKYLKRNKIF